MPDPTREPVEELAALDDEPDADTLTDGDPEPDEFLDAFGPLPLLDAPSTPGEES